MYQFKQSDLITSYRTYDHNIRGIHQTFAPPKSQKWTWPASKCCKFKGSSFVFIAALFKWRRNAPSLLSFIVQDLRLHKQHRWALFLLMLSLYCFFFLGSEHSTSILQILIWKLIPLVKVYALRIWVTWVTWDVFTGIWFCLQSSMNKTYNLLVPSVLLKLLAKKSNKYRNTNKETGPVRSKQKYTIKINSLNTLFVNYINFYNFILGHIAANLTSVSQYTLGSMWCTIQL